MATYNSFGGQIRPRGMPLSPANTPAGQFAVPQQDLPAGGPPAQPPPSGGMQTQSAPNDYAGGGNSFSTAGYTPPPMSPAASWSTNASGTSNNGQIPLTQPSFEQQQQTQLEDQLRQNAWEKRFGAMSGLLGAQGGGIAALPRETMGMSAQEQAARNAAFSRAKDQAGLIGNSAMRGLQDAMSSRGIQGSTIEQEGIGNVLAGAAGGLGHFNQEQLLQDLARSSNIADTTYQGNITQRGQDMQQQQQKQQALIALMNAGGSLY